MSSTRRWAIFCLLLSSTLTGCVAQQVKAWERGQLASEEMAWELDPGLSSYRTHARFSKEAAFSQLGQGGGGCGCN